MSKYEAVLTNARDGWENLLSWGRDEQLVS
jgi:hypothetical protein